jgi:hypothetical protein
LVDRIDLRLDPKDIDLVKLVLDSLDVLFPILKVSNGLGDLVDLRLNTCGVQRALLRDQRLVQLADLVLNLKYVTARL